MSERLRKLPSKQLITSLTSRRSETRNQSAPQPLGGDILTVQGIPDNNQVYLNSLVIGSGAPGEFIYQVQPNNQTLTLWNFGWSIYIDPTVFEANGIPQSIFKWASGSALTVAQNNISVCGYLDWADSSDETNQRTFKVTVHNNDTSNHTYYAAVRFYLPNLNQ